MTTTSSTEASRGPRHPSETADDRPTTAVAPARTARRDLPTEVIPEHPSAAAWLGAFARTSTAEEVGAAGAVLAAHPSEPSKSPAQERLDAYRAAYSGPYRVDGREVAAPPQFRMAGGKNDANAGVTSGKGIDWTSAQVKGLAVICQRAHVSISALGHCLVGGPTSAELRAVTQALIDAGKLPAGPGSLQTRIKEMHWQNGIGIDCTDYVIGASIAASGKTRAQIAIPYGDTTLPSPASDYFLSAASNPKLARTDIGRAKPGDVFCLEPKVVPGEPRDVGHRAIVYSHRTLDAAAVSGLAHAHGSIVTRFAEGGPVHAYEVDASWGAGDGNSFGGVRRDTWLYNESTKQWAELNQRKSEAEPPTFELTPEGPANETLGGLYRFR